MSCVSWFVCCWKKDVRSVEVDNSTAPTGIGGTNGETNALGNGGTNTLEIGGTNALDYTGNGGTKALEGKGKSVTSGQSNITATSFSFQELSMVTGGFKELSGEGGFGRVYKGCLPTGQLVAVKQLDPNGLQGCQEFVTEVLMLCMLSHSNLVNLIGYCTNINQKLLVYEYMPKGCLEDHLFDLTQDKEPLSWSSRMKIAVGVARGLEYLHCKADPSIIYRDMKSANILLDNDFNAKLSDFGLAKLGPIGDNTHVSTRVMGTQGYCAPEYAMTGKLTQQSDIYSFGVVLLELITGRRALDDSRKRGERDLISWSRPFFNDGRKYKHIVDPLLQGNFPNRGLYQIICMIAMCLHEKPKFRPLIGEIVETLEYLASQSTPEVHTHGLRSRPLQPYFKSEIN